MVSDIKPGFWKHPEIEAMEWAIVHDGPLPKSISAVAQMVEDAEYVYMLLGADAPVYIGRSFRPADRISAHRRKPWWHEVETAVIVRITDVPRFKRVAWRDPGPNTARFEALAISALTPSANIVKPVLQAGV